MKFKAVSCGFLLAFASLGLTGCSPGMFLGGKDEGVTSTPNYRRINTACGGMSLSSSTLDVPTFRKILSCFNSNGALAPIEQLLSGLSDVEIEPLVSGTNRYLLNDKKKLFEIDRTYRALESQGKLDDLFFQLGRILENDELISSLLAIFKKGFDGPYSQDILKSIELVSRDLTNDSMSFALDLGVSVTSEPSFDHLKQDFSAELSPYTGSLEFAELVRGIFSYIQEEHTYTCENNAVPVSRDLIRSILEAQGDDSGDLFTALDEIVGTNAEQVKQNILPVVDIFKKTLIRDGGLKGPLMMERLSDALRELSSPVQCMDAAKSIPNASLHLIRELAELPVSSQDTEIAAKYILRDTPLNLMSLGPFCTYPTDIRKHYSTLVEFAKTGAAEPLAQTLKALNRVSRSWKGCDGAQTVGGDQYSSLLYWMVNFLADAGHEEGKRTGIHLLTPTLSEVTHRDAWVDLLLVATLPTSAYQQRVKESVQYLVKTRPELQQRSVYDVLMQVIPQNDFAEIFRLADGLRKFVKDPEPLLKPGLKALRQVLYVNDAHPFLNLVREALSNATQEKAFYSAVFRVASQPEFKASLKLVSEMAKDGRLKELVGATVTLFHKFAEEASNRVVVKAAVEPAILNLRHHWTRQDLVESPYHPVSEHSTWYSTNCDALDITFSLEQTSSPLFDVQLNHFIRCQNGAGANNDVADAIRFLNSDARGNGESFLKNQINLFKKVLSPTDSTYKLSPRDINYLLDGWIASVDDGRFFHLLDALPYWVAPKNSPFQLSHVEQSEEGSAAGFLLKPLLNVSRAVITNAQKDLTQLEHYAAKVLVEAEFPKFLGDVDDLLKPDLSVRSVAPKAPLPAALASFDRNVLHEWVEAKECSHLSNDARLRNEQIEKRIDEILSEAQNNVTNWDLVTGDSQAEGSPRQSWQIHELEDLLNPIFTKIAEKERQSVPQKWVLNSFLNFTGYFSMPPDGKFNSSEEKTRFHYQPQYLLEWLYDRSIDYRPITYYYPGESLPRVRLVNTLDLFELTLINVDFMAPAPIGKNMGLDFLSELADAWGDEPKEMWPPEIQRQYPNPKKPPRTLVSAVDDIVDRPGLLGFDNLKKLTYLYVGLPVLPACHRDVEGYPKDPQSRATLAWVDRWFMNASEKADVERRLYNLWQVNSVLHDNALNKGLRVLRDLFFEMKYSTPPQYLTAQAGDANNLSVILKSVRLGVLRQIGRQLQKFDRNDPVLQDFFQAIVHAGTSPALQSVLTSLIVSDHDHQLIWKVIRQIFGIIDNGNPLDLANMKQMIYYFMATSNRLDPWVPSHQEANPRTDMIDHVLWGADEALNDYFKFWIKPEVDLLEDVLTSKTLSSFARAAYEDGNVERMKRLQSQLVAFLRDKSGDDGFSRIHNSMEILKSIYENDSARESLKVFRKRLDQVVELEGYKKLDLENSFRPILRFFEERNPDGVSPVRWEDADLAKKLRNNFSLLLKDHSLDQLLILEKDNPKEFYQLLETLSRLSAGDRNEGLKNFFIMVRRALSERPY